MAVEPILALEAAVAMMNPLGDLMNSGDLVFYSGAVPANPEAGAGTVLATLEFAAEAFQTATDANPSVIESLEAEIIAEAAESTGEASHFRIGDAGMTSPKFQGTAATATADMVLNVEEMTTAAQVSVETLDISLPSGQ